VIHKHEMHCYAQLKFVKWYLHGMKNGEIDTKLVLSGEAWFHLGGYVNSQNKRYWSVKQPCVNP
jgi:hypothetical protein